MPSLKHEGVLYVQSLHAKQCKKCKAIIESTSLHDFKWCDCGAVGIDGGIGAGNRVLGRPDDMIDMSKWRTQTRPFVWLSREVIQARHAALCKLWQASRPTHEASFLDPKEEA